MALESSIPGRENEASLERLVRKAFGGEESGRRRMSKNQAVR